MGDIKASLKTLLPMLDRKLARHRGTIAALREKAATDREARCATLRDRAKSESVAR
jgi:benzoylformate decarboxylase